MWKYYALLSALFAALTAIFAKIGVRDVNSNLATAIRTAVILIITWGIVFMGNSMSSIKDLSSRTYPIRCGYGIVLVVLFQSITGRRGIESCPCR